MLLFLTYLFRLRRIEIGTFPHKAEVVKTSSGQFPLSFWIRIIFKERGAKKSREIETAKLF